MTSEGFRRYNIAPGQQPDNDNHNLLVGDGNVTGRPQSEAVNTEQSQVGSLSGPLAMDVREVLELGRLMKEVKERINVSRIITHTQEFIQEYDSQDTIRTDF